MQRSHINITFTIDERPENSICFLNSEFFRGYFTNKTSASEVVNSSKCCFFSGDMCFGNATKTWCQINWNISLSWSSRALIAFYLYFTKLQREKPKRHIEREKGEETGGGDKAWNSEKQSSRSLLQFPSHRQVGIKKKTFVGMPNTYMLQIVTQIFNNVCYLRSVLQWRQKVQGFRSVAIKINQLLQPYF